MSLLEALSLENVICRFNASSKKHVLEHLADLAAEQCGATARDILDAIIKREKLGSTGIGAGFAIPHAVVEGITDDFVVMATLSSPIAFDSLDHRPVDVICLVLGAVGQTSSHVSTVAMASQFLRQHGQTIRDMTDTTALLESLGLTDQDSAAA